MLKIRFFFLLFGEARKLLEKEMATHSSVLDWDISWSEEAWQATLHGVVKESDTTYQVNNNKDRMEGSVKGDQMNPAKT